VPKAQKETEMSERQKKDRKRYLAKLYQFYNSTKLEGEWAQYEPKWRPLFFANLVQQDVGDLEFWASQIGKLNLNYTDPIFGLRPLQDGIKIGTATWVFLGRKESIREDRFLIAESLKTREIVVSNGRVAPNGQVFWALWKLDDDGWTLKDRNAGSEADIREVIAAPHRYGL